MVESALETQTIVGLEIHVQLKTATKMFCGCPVKYDAEPNSCVCPVCLGHPGALPVINRRAVEASLLVAAALNCDIASRTKWDRKSYYYPDMPKNYQISQYDQPLGGPGFFEIPTAAGTKRIRIRRAHLEEDAGKNIHDTPGCTLVDLNRAGTPLLEIVTEPDIASAEEAYSFCVELQRLVTYLGVSEASMQKGQMRFEPNVNVVIRQDGHEHKTPISEVKNLNSFRSVRNAVNYEHDRQVMAWQADPQYLLGQAPNENRGWNDDKGVTEFQRGKEAAHDYRYFPDPDLVPLVVTDEMKRSAGTSISELPLARRRRLCEEIGLTTKDADTIVGHRPTADLFDEALSEGAPPDVLGKQFVNVWLRLANDRDGEVTDLGVGAAQMAALATMTKRGTINKTAANRLAETLLDRTESPEQLAEELGLLQVQDSAATQAWVDEAFAHNEQAVRDALTSPKKAKKAAGFLRGQVMGISKGQADPNLVGRLIEKKLAEAAQK
ncbi:MAG: Asp-tRNA(Asn)/Glu-tRNA(Gln) amidotransferase subunit GatB [Planctomycetes bacterium]|nr:Asp-tRNA(Asn)/Glu-tRNA(Gln) amidotransferase subunit GatB [Planctomycetota bacterium]